MDTMDERRVTIQSLNTAWYNNRVAAVDMLRLDLLHEVVSGNKWYKLQLNIQQAIDYNYKTILTLGGGYSNHLVATAYAAKLFGLKSVGIVRGKYAQLTPTLEECRKAGMELIFVTQQDYKNKHQPDWAQNVAAPFGDVFIVPEGGENEWGRAGAGLISRFIDNTYTHIAVAVGTGTTLIGLRNKLNVRQQILGFVPMKQGAYLAGQISSHLDEGKDRNWQLTDEWHFGGFGKWNDELLQFMNTFYRMNGIPLDIVYTSKMMYGLAQMIGRGAFDPGTRILCVHSGGLQGNSSVSSSLDY
jgi:1-aminocyclopropane-1-carboxylate deaminase